MCVLSVFSVNSFYKPRPIIAPRFISYRKFHFIKSFADFHLPTI
nr:MAG TPA: hypothetical protein [Caudoviricetes sp.]